MARYTITESVGSRVLPVHSYEDLHKHHPSSGRQPNREYGTIHGEFEEIRHADGRTFIKKDFVLSQDTRGPVEIPAPVSGYAHFLHDDYNTVQIYDKPYGTPGARREGQVLHMVRGSSPFNEGAHIDYGQPLGEMGQTGSPGSIHAHVELEVGQFQRYITDINDSTIRPGVTPRGVGTAPAAGNDRLLADGARGAAVMALQQHLTTLGYTDAQGQALQADGAFGPATQHAVEAFQRDHQLTVDGKVGPHTATGIDQALARQGVKRLQSELNRLGYTDARGHALQIDGDFGTNTCHAVEAFQRDHQLTVNGKVGPQTQGALEQALKSLAPQAAAAGAAVRLDNPANPDNALYRQAFGLAQRIDEEMGRPSDEHTRRLAAAAVPAAKARGLTRIDALTLSADGSRTFLTQNDPPMKRMAELSTSDAVATPVEQSSAAALHIHRAATQAPTPQTPTHVQRGAASGVTLLA